jgi:broad specificity phosphatase PhoE
VAGCEAQAVQALLQTIPHARASASARKEDEKPVLLHLIRHAQSEANAGVRGAPVDCVLTDLGQRQAEAMARRVAELGVDRVVASPYVRALQTADAIRVAAGVPAAIVPLLHEHHVNPFPGEEWPLLSRTSLTERFPQFALPEDFTFDPRWHDVPETEEGVLTRARGVLQDLWERYAAAPDGSQEVRLAVVSHGSPTGKLVMAALGLPSPKQTAVRIDNASISTVEYYPDWRVLVATNRVDHLAHLSVDFKTQDPGYPGRRGA